MNHQLGLGLFLDHFIVNSDVFNSINELSCFSKGINLSDHAPVIIDFNLLNVDYHELNSNNSVSSRTYDWDSATTLNLNAYKVMLDCYINDINFDNDVIGCQSLVCDSHKESIMEYVDKLCQAMISAADLTIPFKKVTKSKGIPGWNTYVKPYRDNSIFCHEMWVQAGRPTTGFIAENRRASRSKYHSAINFVKRNREKILKYNSAHYLRNKNFKEFWKTINNFRNFNIKQSNNMDGVSGIDSVASIFKDKFEKLYSSHNTDYKNYIDNANEKIEFFVN